MKKLFKVMAVFVLATSAILNLVACNNQTGGSVNPCAHEWVVANTVVGTCSVEGKEEYECKKCDETKTESTGFGAHTTEQIFDGEYHWQVNTCEHENTPEKIAHSLTDGVCECGFYSIDKIVENYNALAVFEQGTNIQVKIEFDRENYFNLNFKDNVMKAESSEMAIRYVVFEDGYLYGCNLENEWFKMQATEILGNNIKLVNIFTEMIHVDPIINLLDIEFSWVENNKWEALFEIGAGKVKTTVIAENGMIKQIDILSLESSMDSIFNMTFSYGTAEVGEVPEIDYDNVNGGGNTDGPSASNSIEQIIQNYSNLKVFESGQNYTVSIRMEDDEEDLAIFIVEDDVVKAEVYGSGVAYMLIEGDTVYMSQNEFWQKGDKDEFFAEMFGDNDNTIGGLIECLYLYDGTLMLPIADYQETDINQWTCELNEQDRRVVIQAENGKVKRIEHFDSSTEERLWAFDFTYGDAEVGTVPTPDYENAEEMFHPSNTPDVPDYSFEQIVEKFEKLYIFGSDLNLVMTNQADYDFGAEVQAKGYFKNDIFYLEPMFYLIQDSVAVTGGRWIIYDGSYVYFADKDYKLVGNSELKEFAKTHTHQEVMDYINAIPFDWKKFTLEEFADFVLCEDPEKIHFFPAVNYGPTIKDALGDGIEYEYVGNNTWQGFGDVLNSTNIEILVTADENGRITKIEHYQNGKFLSRFLYEYGNAQLPEIPDYKAD